VKIVYTSTGSLGAAIVLGSVIVVVAVIAALDAMGAIARIIMAQARDQALPFSNIFSKIDINWNTPVNALILAATLQAAIATIYIGNSTAYFGIVSGVLTLQVISYGIPIVLHLFQRKTTLNLEYGPWKLGRWGRVANVIGLVLYVFIFVAVSLPTEVPVTAQNMYGSDNFKTPMTKLTYSGTTLHLSQV
jgi:choline transport protein